YEARQGARTDHDVHGDLEWKRCQQRQQTRQQAEQEQGDNERPVGPGQAEQPPEQDEVGVASHDTQAPPAPSRLSVRAMRAAAAAHSRTTQRASARVTAVRIVPAAHAPAAAPPTARAAKRPGMKTA